MSKLLETAAISHMELRAISADTLIFDKTIDYMTLNELGSLRQFIGKKVKLILVYENGK